jgi:hypothetical protein
VDVAVGLGVGRLDHTVDVDAGALRIDRELVGQADVDVAVGGLRELGELGGLGRPEIPDAVGPVEIGTVVELEDLLVEGLGTRGALLGHPAHQLGVRAQVPEDAAGQHPLGREDQMEVGPFDQAAAGFQGRLPPRPGGAHGQRGLVDHERVRREMRGDVVRCAVDRAEVGAAVGVHEQRYDDEHHVGRGDRLGVVGGGDQVTGRDQPLEVLGEVGLAGERLLAGVDGRDRLGVDVDAGHLMAHVRELCGQGQPDLAEPDDGDPHG